MHAIEFRLTRDGYYAAKQRRHHRRHHRLRILILCSMLGLVAFSLGFVLMYLLYA